MPASLNWLLCPFLATSYSITKELPQGENLLMTLTICSPIAHQIKPTSSEGLVWIAPDHLPPDSSPATLSFWHAAHTYIQLHASILKHSVSSAWSTVLCLTVGLELNLYLSFKVQPEVSFPKKVSLTSSHPMRLISLPPGNFSSVLSCSSSLGHHTIIVCRPPREQGPCFTCL